MDRIDLYRVFARVVECASFTRAADMLGLPRSSVSAAVKELEMRVGARLLARTTRKVAPTHDGSVFYERCLRLIAEVEEVEGLFQQAGAGPSGHVRVDLPGRIGRLIVAPALPEFLARYPGITVELGVTDRMVNLVGEGVDCTVRVGFLGESRLIARSIGHLRLVNVASSAYLARHGTPKTPADLGMHEAVHFASPSTGRVEDWEWVEDGAVRRQAMHGRVTVNSAEAQIAAALAGLGLIQIPAYDVRHHIERGELVEIMPGHCAEPMQMTLLYPHRRQRPHRLRVFADWLVPLLARKTAG